MCSLDSAALRCSSLDSALILLAAEFRGPGVHNHFSADDSPDDYDMDMDQRTRTLGGGRGGRIILLGDGTELGISEHDDDGDIDMEDRGEAEELEDKDLAEQVKKGQSQSASTTSNPGATIPTTAAASATAKEVDDTKKTTGSAPEPEIKAASDSVDVKTLEENKKE
nr:hypothetical protein CFP56_24080 [Quercus suber]